MVQELLIALAEAAAVVGPGRRRDGRVAEAWVLLQVRRAAVGDIAAGGLKAVVDALVVDLHARRRRPIVRSRMRAAGQ